MPLVRSETSVPFYEAMRAAGATIHSCEEFKNDDDSEGWVVCATFDAQLLFLCWTHYVDAFEEWQYERDYEDRPSVLPSESQILAFGAAYIRKAVPYEQLGPMLRHTGLRKLGRARVFKWLRALPNLQAYRALRAARKTLASASPKYLRS